MAATICRDYVPGAIGRITELHARYYHQHWGFGLFFEAKVAAGLAAFLQHYQPERDGLWTAHEGGQIIGAIALDRQHGNEAAHLRYFILDPAAQGQGLGAQLLASLLAFADAERVPLVYLNTFAGLDAARRLYERAGFVLVHEQPDRSWGVVVHEQRFERVLPA
jgi:RimJ/RimL family protein N-acetyltransferase